jgi:solute carrier family 20 (sodium-dependent phosphate transporter)
MYLWIFICGLFFAFYNAWGIGANDCANSFATSVGAKVLTLRQAVIIAAIFEFAGAVLMGSHVTNIIRKKIVELDIFEDNPGSLMFGMLCADLSSAIWLTIGTYFKLPVSTTHSIIGAIIGFSLAFGGVDAVNWEKVGLIVASWVASPFLAGLFSSAFFTIINNVIFKSNNPIKRILNLFPILTFFTFFINVLFIIYKGSPQLELDELPFWLCFIISFTISSATGLLSYFFYIPYVKHKTNLNENLAIEGVQIEDAEEVNERTESYLDANTPPALELDESGTLNTETDTDTDITQNINTRNNRNNSNDETSSTNETESTNETASNNDLKYNDNVSIKDNIQNAQAHVKRLEGIELENKIESLHENADNLDPKADQLCSWMQIITACFSSFAHGSNDVANAIAPLATIYHIYRYESITKTADVPIWILLLGGIGIVFGLSTWGYKIINRMGRELTKITPSRGFIIELSAALTVVIASRAEIPVSTTHCQVGSIVGCGLVGGTKNIQWPLLKNILASWLITLPFTGLLSAALFSYGYYSPNEHSIINTYSDVVTSNISSLINTTLNTSV